MKKVLIISYFFPPDPEIGSLRIKGLVKYLPYFGWKPLILTKNLPDPANLKCEIIKTALPEYNVINEFKNKIGLNPKETVNKQLGISDLKNRTRFFDRLQSFASSFIAYPDEKIDWYSHAFELGDQLLTSNKIDGIISSSFPVTSHLIAHDLSIKYCTPWIADLRDLWTQNPYYSYGSLRRRIDRSLEVKTFFNACALVTTTRKSAEVLGELHSNKPIYSIPNGFDPDEFTQIDIEALTEKFTISYTGNLYQGKRDPSKLFKALHELILEKKIDPNNVEVRFYGPKEDWISQDIETYELQGIFISYGIFPRDYIFQKQLESQLLLILQWDNPKEQIVCPGKIYEYLAAKRPILAIGPGGAVSDLLSDTMAGTYTSSVDDIKEALFNYYLEYKSNGYVPYKGINEKIDKYSQKEMARKFSLILSEFSDSK